MSFIEAVASVMSQYATFSGRARRSEYWYFYLAVMIAQVPFFLAAIFFEQPAAPFVYIAAIVVPLYAVGARRLHDTGRSGWWQLLVLVPIAGPILLVVWLTADSSGDNEYGPDPKRTRDLPA